MKPTTHIWVKLGKSQRETWNRVYKECLTELKQGYAPEIIAHNVALLAAWDMKTERKHGFLVIK